MGVNLCAKCIFSCFAAMVACAPSGMAQTASDPTATALGQYYRQMEAQLVGRGHLRQDRGGHAVNADTLARSFMAIAMHSEYRVGGGGLTRSGHAMPLNRWEQPVRISLHFGASVPRSVQIRDTAVVRDVAGRLARASRHSVQVTGGQGNFHVLVLDDAERAAIGPTLRAMVPGISRSAVNAVTRMNRNTFCMVVAMPGANPAQGYARAIAIVRAEHPSRMRRSCIEEELAQGMGLPNDSRGAWPSIFNDDEEFGVLTRHDEMLLRMLYDRRLQPGMRASDVAGLLPALCRAALGLG